MRTRQNANAIYTQYTPHRLTLHNVVITRNTREKFRERTTVWAGVYSVYEFHTDRTAARGVARGAGEFPVQLK